MTAPARHLEVTPAPDHPCMSPDCPEPARLRAGGWLCDGHLPLPFVSDILGKDLKRAA